jgi:PPOX class probable F420-dependent enzyme
MLAATVAQGRPLSAKTMRGPVSDNVAAVGFGERMAYAMDRVYDRMRDPSVFRIQREDATAGTFDSLRGYKYGLLVTFRRNGDPVPSPVWMALDAAGRAYIQTGAKSGKVKRIRNDQTALIAASNVRGKPRGPLLLASALVLPREEWPHAEATLAAAFGLGRKIYQRAFPMSSEVAAYLQVVPASDG